MDADFSDTDYMLFEETADARSNGDVIHNILSACRKPGATTFVKITDDGIPSAAYDKYHENVLLDQPDSPPINLLAFGLSSPMDLPEENAESIDFADNISFDNILATTEIGEIEEHYIQSVSSSGDFLDTEENDLTLFKELQEDGELCCPSDQSVSSTCLELIADNFEEDACNGLNDLERTEAEKNCRVQFFKMSSLKDNRRTRNGLNKDRTVISNSQIQTELNSDYLEKRYVLLVDASDDETIEDNRSLITFLEFDPSVVAQNETDVSCQNNKPEVASSYDFYFDGEGKEIPPSEVVNLGSSNLSTGGFILDCNQNLNETGTIPILELEEADKIKGSREEVQCANERIVVIKESEKSTGQIEEEFVTSSGEESPENLKLLDDEIEEESQEEPIQYRFQDEMIQNNEINSIQKSSYETLSSDVNSSHVISVQSENALIESDLSVENSYEQTGKVDDKHESENIGDKAVHDMNNADVSGKPESLEKHLRTDSEDINTREITETNRDEDSSVSKLQETSQEQRIEEETSGPIVDELTEPVIALDQQESGDRIDHVLRETKDEFVDEFTEPSDINTEIESGYINQSSTVNALQFMLLREMWRNKGLGRRQSNTVQSDLEQNQVFIALLKEFLMKKNCDKYMPQLTGIDVFIRKLNIQADIKTKGDNIESQKENCSRQSNKSSAEPSLDKSPAIIANEYDVQGTELDVPHLETETEESLIPKNNLEIVKRNIEYEIEVTLPLRKELRPHDYANDAAEPVSEPKKTVNSNPEGNNHLDEEETDETNQQNVTKDKSTDDACFPISNCSSRDGKPISNDVEQLENNNTITDGQCSSKICDSPEILRLEYLKDISFQPFVKLEVLNLRDHLALVKRDKYRQENRKSHRRINPRITTQLKQNENVECELLISQNGKDTDSESCAGNTTIKADTIENIILPESPKPTKIPAALIMRKSPREPENEKIFKADVIRPKRKFASNPVVAQTAITEKINSTNTLVPRLERIDTMLDLPMKLSEPLRPLKIIYEIGRKLTPAINDIYLNKANKLQRKLSVSQKNHIRRHRRKQSNTNVEIIPEISYNGVQAAKRDEQHTVSMKAADGNENLKDKEISDSDSKGLRSERLIGSNLPKLRDKQLIEKTRTVGTAINKGKIRVVRFTKMNVPVKRKRGRPRRQDSIGEETEIEESTCKETREELTRSISEVVVNQQTDKTGPIRKRRSTPRVKNLIQSNSTTDESSFKKTTSTDNTQLKKLDLSDHEKEINDTVLRTTRDTFGYEVNQHSDEKPLIQRKSGRLRRQESTREEVENKELTCTRTGEGASERTSETVVNQESVYVVAAKRKTGKLRARNLIQRNKRNNRLLCKRRTRITDNMQLRKLNILDHEERLLDSAVPTTGDTFETEVDQLADETPLIERRRGRQTRQDSTSMELRNRESTRKDVSEPAKTVLDYKEPDKTEVQTSGSIVAQRAVVPIKRKRAGRRSAKNLTQKKPKTDESLFESRRIIDTTKLKKLTVVLTHKDLIDNLPARTTQDTSRSVLSKHSAYSVPIKRKKDRARCQASTDEKVEDKESACTNTDHEEPVNDLDLQTDVPIKRKRGRPHDKNLVEQKTKHNRVLLRKLRSTDAGQSEKFNESEGDDRTKEPKQDKNNHMQNTPDSSIIDILRRRTAKTLAREKASKEKVKSTAENIEIGKTVDSAIIKEKKTNLLAEENLSDKQNDKQLVEVPKKSNEAVEIASQENAVGTIQRARNNLHNELYKLYFTNFFTSNGHIVRFQYVSGRLAVLDAKIANVDRAESFVKAFAQFDCANYLLWKDFDRERYILHRTWLCGTNGHQNSDVLYKSLSCQARIHISIKQPSSNDYNAHVLIYMEHTHNSMSKEKLVNISRK